LAKWRKGPSEKLWRKREFLGTRGVARSLPGIEKDAEGDREGGVEQRPRPTRSHLWNHTGSKNSLDHSRNEVKSGGEKRKIPSCLLGGAVMTSLSFFEWTKGSNKKESKVERELETENYDSFLVWGSAFFRAPFLGATYCFPLFITW